MSSWPPGQSALPPTGWYADPADPTRERYWGGTEWTHDVRSPAPPAPAAPAAPAGYSPEPPSFSPVAQGENSGAYVPMARPTYLDDAPFLRFSANAASPSTTGIWIIAWSPAIYFGTQFAVYALVPVITSAPALLGFYGAYLILLLLAVIWDSAELRRRQLPAPSIAWVFLSIIAYLIARRFALRRIGVLHSAPSIIYALVLVASIALASFGFNTIASDRAENGAQANAIATVETELEKAGAKMVPGEWSADCPADAAVSMTGTEFRCILTGPVSQPVVVTMRVTSPYSFVVAKTEGGGTVIVPFD
jgi:hypothetical protein